MITHLLYLHGFKSSPLSTKSQQVAGWMRKHRPDVRWWCPQLPPSPDTALALISEGMHDWSIAHSAVIGSSLGGFYATVLAERTGMPAVLLNPAVNPARDLVKHIGETKSWHGDEQFFFRAEYVDELLRMTPTTITRPERYFALIAKGDEVLDWREMSARYAGCPMCLLEGGDHAISDFEQHLSEVARFLGLDVTSG